MGCAEGGALRLWTGTAATAAVVAPGRSRLTAPEGPPVVPIAAACRHRDLAPNIATAPGGGPLWLNAISGADSSNAFDDNGHGSHAAGILGAAGNNSRGVVGVNWQVRPCCVPVLPAAGAACCEQLCVCEWHVGE